MGTRTYKSDEFDRFSEREARKREWYEREMKKKRQALAILIGMGLAAIAVLVVIIVLLVKLFSPKDTAEVENNLSNTPSGEISLVDNQSDDAIYGSGSGSGSGIIGTTSERGLIVIDAGHGGYDSGCISATKYEKDIDLDIALVLADKLRDKGFGVYMTRTDDSFVGINDRADLANKCEGALALISIHQNSSDKASDEGVEVWTSKTDENEQLAQLIVDEVSSRTGAINGGVKTKDNLVICSKAEMPAVVVECGYLSNKREAQNLSDEAYQDKIATAIVSAVDTFIPPKK
ncbi:MAG: N-acetylmuramoyl-L-alanine amidase [Lachnospiraceae bacterium]|nr:N-acetylmuramoyl-L-alanine amidase [Lachnospiraceae bacterium]MBR5369337.1 N-acetylmuramoyl-L-alanine amidase [Lachnospiraceae bacterium]